MGVYAHELSHVLGIGDNYNNPYGDPPRRTTAALGDAAAAARSTAPAARTAAGPIPATGGGSMGAQHMLRNKMKLGIVDERHVLRLSREALADSGARRRPGDRPRGRSRRGRA